MKVVIFGLTVSSSWGNGHATLWRGLCRALAGRGHRIVFFERDVPYYAEHRDLAASAWSDGELRLYADFGHVRYPAARHLADADVADVTSYCPDALAATELVLASRVPLRVFYELGRHDEYLGTLVNEYLARGGEARGVRCGEAYVDVGTLHGYGTRPTPRAW